MGAASSSAPVAVIACGALAARVREVSARHDWPVEVHPLPALLHDRPEKIPPRVAELASALQATGRTVAVAYADCGTYGALDGICSSLGLHRLGGLHCYDVIAGAERVRRLLEEEPGTYLLTDYLVASFAKTVVAELGLDRHPELAADYFGHYRRVVWLSENRTEKLARRAAGIAELLGLPLETLEVGTGGIERELEALLAASLATEEPQ